MIHTELKSNACYTMNELYSYITYYVDNGFGTVFDYLYMLYMGEISKCYVPNYVKQLDKILPPDFKFSEHFYNKLSSTDFIFGMHTIMPLICEREHIKSVYDIGLNRFYGNAYYMSSNYILCLYGNFEDDIIKFSSNKCYWLSDIIGGTCISDIPLTRYETDDLTLIFKDNVPRMCYFRLITN